MSKKPPTTTPTTQTPTTTPKKTPTTTPTTQTPTTTPTTTKKTPTTTTTPTTKTPTTTPTTDQTPTRKRKQKKAKSDDGEKPEPSKKPKGSELELKAEEKEKDLDQAIKFLKNKGVGAGDPVLADLKFGLLKDPAKAKKAKAKYAAAQERLLELFGAEAETQAWEVPPNVQKWDPEQVRNWGYTADSCFLFRQPHSLTQRVQRHGGLCSHHGACCTQYYRISHSGIRSPMLDLVKYMKNNCSASELEAIVFEDYGVPSVDFLCRILAPNSNLEQLSGPGGYAKANELLNQYGPALVSMFTVHADFEDLSVHRHLGKPVGEKRGIHSMTLIGARSTADNQYFLLQNWWAEKQFVEVDLKYLAGTGATLSFITTPQMGIPKNFASDYHSYHESSLDKQERHS